MTCDCRKPAPGLLLQAAADLHLDPVRSYMVGDTLKDIEAGARAGAKGVLVRTGYGAESAAALGLDEGPGRKVLGEMEHPDKESILFRPVHIAEDILDAVRWIVRNLRP